MKIPKRTLEGIAKVFADNLRLYRSRAGFSQADVADRLGLAVATVSGWELGKQPAFAYLDAIAKLFGVGVNDLFTPQNTPKEFTIETDSDFAECIWALVRSRYVMTARLLQPICEHDIPSASINLGLNLSGVGQQENSSELMGVLSVVFKI